MAANTWPSTIPQRPSPNGYSESPGKNTIRSQMDTGPSKQRRRSTAAARPITCSFEMTAAEVATFEDFFLNTLNDGSLAFNWKNPRTNSDAEFRFTQEYSLSNQGGDNWLVNCSLEQLP